MPRLARGLARLGFDLSSAALGVLLLTVPASGQETTRVSVDSSGVEGDLNSFFASISADGRVVAFYSYASNLVAGDTNGSSDVFVHDRSTGVTERVSVDSSGAEGNDYSYLPAISADGQTVAYASSSSNLVAGDTNNHFDIFVHDRSTGITERVSVRSNGKQGNGDSYDPAISADGQIVAFRSWATNLVTGDTNGTWDIFVHDRSTGVTERVSVDSSAAEANDEADLPAISADGQIVAFSSDATNLVSGDTNRATDVFVHDRSTGITERVSVDSSGAEGNDYSYRPAISTDGIIVAFSSGASNLVAGDTNGTGDIFVHDRSTGLTERVSVDSTGAEGNNDSSYPAISAGQIVAFTSWASNLVAGDTNGSSDIFVHNRSTGLTERVSVDSAGAEGNSDSQQDSAISADGQVVAFMSAASNLVAGDTNGRNDVFVHERCSIDATWSNYGAGWPGTLGEPSIVSNADPELGTSITITLSNSLGADTPGLLLVGLAQANLPTSKDGTLLLVPLLWIPLLVPTSGAALSGTIPDDNSLCGLEIDLQALELDPGASKGVSFTPGLELVIGH
jgi:cold shock CspA family protein